MDRIYIHGDDYVLARQLVEEAGCTHDYDGSGSIFCNSRDTAGVLMLLDANGITADLV